MHGCMIILVLAVIVANAKRVELPAFDRQKSTEMASSISSNYEHSRRGLFLGFVLNLVGDDAQKKHSKNSLGFKWN